MHVSKLLCTIGQRYLIGFFENIVKNIFDTVRSKTRYVAVCKFEKVCSSETSERREVFPMMLSITIWCIPGDFKDVPGIAAISMKSIVFKL